MGLGMVLTDYTGRVAARVDDPKNFLHRLLPTTSDSSKSVLAKIDWYGDTYFNHLQIKQFLEEWDRLARRVGSDEEAVLVREVRDLAVRCQNDSLLLLRFIGD